jgi:hypothetical protein
MATQKRLLFLCITLLAFTSFTTFQGNYVGEWQKKGTGEISFLTLSPDGFATLQIGRKIIGGKAYNYQGVKCAMKYKINKGTFPTAIDLIATEVRSGREITRLKGIVKMNSPNEMQIELVLGGVSRPTSFSSKAVLLKRTR